MLKGFVRVELHHRLCRDPPRLSRKDVLPGILWVAKHMQVFVHYSTPSVSFLHSTLVACSSLWFGFELMSACMELFLIKIFLGCQSLHSCIIPQQLRLFVVDIVRVSLGLLVWPLKPIWPLKPCRVLLLAKILSGSYPLSNVSSMLLFICVRIPVGSTSICTLISMSWA